MRIADRIAKLEARANSADPRLTEVEINASAVEFERQVERYAEADLQGFTRADAAVAWRAVVEGTRPPLQRAYASSAWEDLFL